ncbi:MAG: hypothetical protein M1835_005388 [Candelina submexicana]|nr:MAG: hypothetical protein M1835_005388 [Candelina submexicana]
MAAKLWQRDVVAELKAAPRTLSSWDSCMAKGYCKWPAIAGCVVASIIVLSLLCGQSKNHKHVDHNPFRSSPYHGYQHTPRPPAYEPSKYAQFDVSRGAKPHDDALPAMPMWEKAEHRKIHDHDHNAELGHVDHNAGQRVPMLSSAPSPPHGYHEVKGSLVTSQQFLGGYSGGDVTDTSYNNRPQYTAYSPLGDVGPDKRSYSRDTGFGRKPVNGSWKEI